jgi:RHS repeat-associated protein
VVAETLSNFLDGRTSRQSREHREISFTWRADGQPATVTEHGITTTFTYDDLGSHNVVLASDTLGRTASLAYDAFGNLTSTSDGTASASFVFDLGNRLRTSRDALGNETTFRYENIDCGCTEQDEVTGVHTPDLPAGVEWAMTYGAQGRLASVTDPHGFTESYTYEPTGEVKTVKDRLARTTTMAHDQLGRLLAMVDTLGRRHGRSYSVPTSGAWTGPTLTSGSAAATAATSTLTSSLRDGDYQIGVNALQPDGLPAQISLYRDATFALGYTHYFDNAERLIKRTDRTPLPIDSTTIPNAGGPGAISDLSRGYDLRTSAPLINSMVSNGAQNEGATFQWGGVELDLTSSAGFGSGGTFAAPATYVYTRDAGGRVTTHTNTFAAFAGPSTFVSTYTYYPDGRLASNGNADGGHSTSSVALPSGTVLSSGSGTLAGSPPNRTNHVFTYDARGLLATQTDFDGTYRYAYDELGRSKRLEFPDGDARVQIYDEVGRIISRCYEYADPSLSRCYGAQYDPVGNPVRLTDPEGSDVFQYDALDRLTKATRLDRNDLPILVEDYAFNALGALALHAGAPVDHRRPRLDGAGLADAAVPATVDGVPVTLDVGGRVSALQGANLAWSKTGQLRHVDLPVPQNPVEFAFDAFDRRVSTQGPATIGLIANSISFPAGQELYLYEGVHRIAAVAPESARFTNGVVLQSFLYDGVDHPLRLSSPEITVTNVPALPQTPQVAFHDATPRTVAYYELDLAGNVRRLRQPGGLDLGGYRYSAFGETLEDTVVLQTANPLIVADNRTQPLRWKGMWRYDFGGGVELYDARARMWSPKLGTFLSVDEFAFHDARGTLWGWPGQNSIRWRDPSGRIGMGDSASSDRAIGSPQNWGDSSFQTGLKDSAVFDAFALAQLTPLGYLLDAGLFVASDKDLPLLGLMGAPRVGGEAAAEAALDGGSCRASTPVGRKGQPLGGFNPTKPTNAGGEVGGRQFSVHAFDRMQSQGIPPSAVENTIENGVGSSGKVPGTEAHYDPVNNITVI